MTELKIVTYNVRGLGAPNKRGRLWCELRGQRVDVIFLQETHFTAGSIPRLPGHPFNQWFHSTSPIRGARGVTIAINRTTPFSLEEVEKDLEGRFLCVKGRIENQFYTFASIYAPNTGTVDFISKTMKKLEKLRKGILILGGDFNLTLDPEMDTSSGKTVLSFRAQRHLKKSLRELHLVDSWRTLHGRERDYSYYSRIHNTYSRIDLLLVDQFDLHLVKTSVIGSITISDHAPVVLGIRVGDVCKKERNWRLNESILDDKRAFETLKGGLMSYFEINKTDEVSNQVVWEAHKVVIRGEMISQGSRLKKEKQKEITDVLEEIHKIEIKHKKSRDPEEDNKLLELRLKLTKCLDLKLKNKQRYFAHRFYEQGSKGGKMLARQLKKLQESRHVHKLTAGNKQVTDSHKIAAEFQRYYRSLYSIEGDKRREEGGGRRQEIREYLRTSELPEISPAALQEMEQPITGEELSKVVGGLALGKSPGPDGFTNLYYKKFLPELAQPLCDYLNSVKISKPLSTEALMAHVTVLPKEGRDPQVCANYRPISLLNSDTKILSKILALRMQDHIETIIQLDQTGFIKGRESRDNTIRALQILHWAQNGPERIPRVLISMDAEKAFDRVGWVFLSEVLRGVGLGERMMGWVLALYNKPRARVKVNGVLSESFEIRNGTRQGCPLSPLLFALILEPFLCRIRRNGRINGIRIGAVEHKVSAYADDLLFYLSKPRESLEEVMGEIERFGALSNFKINPEKSILMPSHVPSKTRTAIQANFPFIWNMDSLRYLGINLTANLKKLYELNYGALLANIQSDLKSWKGLLMTWFGRVNVIKMNVLPRIIYILYTIPITLPQIFFKQIKRALTKFVWGDKHPRISYEILRRQKEEGGLGLPDVNLYYKAMALVRILNWRHDTANKIWVNLEKTIAGRDLEGAPWIPTANRGLSEWTSPMTKTTLSVWDKANALGKIAPMISPLAPLEGFPWFEPGEDKKNLEGWGREGGVTCARIAPSGKLIPLKDLIEEWGDIPMSLWRYFQITDFYNKRKSLIRPLNTLTVFESWNLKIPETKHLLSRMYKLLLNINSTTTPYFIKEWERELGGRFSTLQVKRLFKTTHTSSISSHTQEMAYKFLVRWYRTPVRIAQMLPKEEARCWRGCEERGTYLHIWWTCPKIKKFWEALAPWIRKMTEKHIEFSAFHFLFHGMPTPNKVYKKSIIPHLLNAAKALVPRYWKNSRCPTILDWKKEVDKIMEAEEWVHRIKDKQEEFDEIWKVWKQQSNEIV